MVFKFFKNIKNYNKGITLVEIVIVIFIIALFSIILVTDFPKILRQLSLESSTYKLSQDLRSAQDLGLSGVTINNASGTKIPANGYGVYVDLSSQPAEKYIIYANLDQNQTYNGSSDYANNLCSNYQVGSESDCVMQIIDVSKTNPNVYIAGTEFTEGSNSLSINFTPPDPITNITDDSDKSYAKVGITLGLTTDPSATKTVLVYTSGLINVTDTKNGD